MIGDVLLVEQKHERVARELAAKIHKRQHARLVVAIGGESGSGKSEIAETLRQVLKNEDYKVKILHCDNYYKIAPDIRNDYRKKHGVSTVGIHEINWEVLEENIEAFRERRSTTIPFLDLFTSQEDKLISDFSNIDLLIVEGLYACASSADINVYIDVTYHETKKAQIKRKKEKMDSFRLKVLEKEHQEVITLRKKTDYFVSPDFTLVDNTTKYTPLEEENSGRRIFVSDHLPIKLVQNRNQIDIETQIDGVCVAIDSVYSAYESIWFGACSTTDIELTPQQKSSISRRLMNDHKMHPIFDSGKEEHARANLFCKRTLWPIFHYFVESSKFNESWWDSYVAMNTHFYKKIKKSINEKDTLWIHGYQLMLLPELIRRDFPDITIGFFFHVPFPSFEVFRLLPWKNELLRGVLGADLVGFHIYEYTRHFQSSVYRILGHDSNMGNIQMGNRIVHIDAISLGINSKQYSMLAKKDEVIRKVETLFKHYNHVPVILSLDRLDYTKGIQNKLKVIDLFFETHSEMAGKVIFQINILPPFSKQDDFIELKRDIEKQIYRCNKKYRTKEWQPIHYDYKFLTQEELVSLYNVAEVFLVATFRDGLNLLIKEYLASRDEKAGVIVCSEFIGGAQELTEAIIFNPNNHREFINSLLKALTMPEDEKISAFNKMKRRLERNNALDWAVNFMEGLKSIKAKQAELQARLFTHTVKTRLLTDFYNSEKRLIALDYNGTLVPIKKMAQCLPPDKSTLNILKALTEDTKNKIIILSDNEKENLASWFNHLPIDLIASSDLAFRKAGSDWTIVESLSAEWKHEVLPIFEKYVNRTPGAYISEKRYSLVWRFERASKEQGNIRSRELMDDLKSYVDKNNLQVNEGERLIEVKNGGIYKGKILQSYFEEEKWDFVCAVGDDWTNEPMFQHLPDHAYSIRIGITATHAKFNLKDQKGLTDLLKTLVNKA